MRLFAFAAALACSASAALAAAHGQNQGFAHVNALGKRYTTYAGGVLTFYSGGALSQPACGGQAPTDNSMAVAVPAGSPAHCGDWVHITYQGKHVAAKVVDECATCKNAHSVDATRAVFQELGSLETGELQNIQVRVMTAN